MNRQAIEFKLDHLHQALSELRPPGAVEERFKSIVVTDRIDCWDRYLYIGPEAEDLLGYSPSQYYEGEIADDEQECGWVANNHPEDVWRTEILWQRVLAGHRVPPVEYRSENTDGKWVWLEDTFTPFEIDSQGRSLIVEGRWRDITPRKRREIEFLIRQFEEMLSEGGRPASSRSATIIPFRSRHTTHLARRPPDAPIRRKGLRMRHPRS